MSSKELVISSTRHETRLAIMEDDQLVEVYFQRSNEYSLAGSIHKGRVTRVLPGMQSAFVDLGLERDTFLYVSDFYEEHSEDIDKVTGGAEERPVRAPREAAAPGGREAIGGRDGGGREGGGGRDDNRRGGRRDRDRGGRDRDRSDRPSDRDRSRITPTESAYAVPAPAPSSSSFVVEPEEPLESFDGPLEDLQADAESPLETLPGETLAASAASPADRPQGADRGPRGADSRDRGAGDRRGRRRGRGRGRGLPESKYAAADSSEDRDAEPVADASEPPIAATVAPVFFRPPVEDADVFVLPGESLRKYRGAQPPPLPAVEAPTIVEEAVVLTAPVEEIRNPQLPPPLPASVVEYAAAELAAAEPQVIEEPVVPALTPAPDPIEDEEEELDDEIEAEDEAEEHPAANALPDAPLHPERVEFLNEQEIREALEDSDPVDDTDDFESAADAAQEAAEAQEDGDSDDEDPEIQAMILNGESHQDEDSDEPNLEAVQDEAEAAADGQPVTAQVRGDRNQRYLRQDNNRRQRGRRGRGRERGDRPERSPQQQQSPVADGEVAPVIFPSAESAAGTASAPAPVTPRADRHHDRNRPMPSISDLLKEGQEIIVQIAKEPLGQKGARITSHIALPGRYVVFMPTVEHMGVSRKIASDEERHRLKRILQGVRGSVQGGCIIRTAGEGQPDEEIVADIQFLHNLWQDIKTKADKRPAPILLHHDLDIVQRVLRDQVNESYKAVWVDSEEMYESIVRFVQRFQPNLLSKVKLYTRTTPIFDAFNITNELEKALRPKVWLKSGGYIVINQTEALVAIDINTGKFVGKSNRLEDTIVRTNLEAVKEIVRQIRLRDLGGIIVIDFIDMDERKNRQKVMQALEEAMRFDRAPYKILQFNDFGLVAVTRKRVKQSLERTLCSPCPYCEGAGYVKSVSTIVSEIVAEAIKLAPTIDHSDVVLRCNPEVAKLFKSHHNQYLEELEEILKRPVLVKSDAALHQEKFDLA
jgi:ribonuclease G